MRLQHKCFPMKFEKMLIILILKNICKQLLLEVFCKKVVLKKLFFAIFAGAKAASDKCSVKKVFLVVDRVVKMTCVYIDQHLL